MNKTYGHFNPAKLFLPVLLTLFMFFNADAQSLLNKKISVSFNKTRVADALNDIGNKGGFYFSYNGNLLHKDSLVALTAANEEVSAILSKLLNNKFDYEERRNYIILTPALLHLAIINTDITNDGGLYSISGLVIDEQTGTRLIDASVYDKRHAIATLTDEHGYFRLKFRADSAEQISITAARLLYRDTAVTLLKMVSVNSRADRRSHAASTSKSSRVEKTGLGKLLISTRQKIQSLNIPDFFAKRPFQFSLAPGLSSHGMFSPQVVNKFSLNVAGGYTAGVNGVEIGGLFNIDKMDAKYLQFAGVFNLVGGNVSGVQLAGVNNRVLDTVNGLQLAGFINRTEGAVNGAQISVLNNQAHVLNGLQVGLINIVDTSRGASFGLFNIIHNGFYKASVFASDVTNTNFSLQTGTHNFYTSVILSANASDQEKLYAMGIGVGHDFMLSRSVYVAAGVNYLFANTGLWDDRWKQATLSLNVQLSKNLSLFAGPTFNSYNHSGSTHLPGYKNVTDLPEYPGSTDAGHQVKNWTGWQAGIAFNSVFKKRTVRPDTSDSWRLGVAATVGIGWDQPLGAVYGTEIFAMRSLGGNIAALLSLGYTDYTLSGNRYYFAYTDPTTGVYAEEYQNDFRSIPLKAGVRAYLSKHLFVEGDLGEAFALNNIVTNISIDHGKVTQTNYLKLNSFLYAASVGYTFNNGLETGIKFESYSRYTNFSQFAFRLAYSFKAGK